MARKKPEKNGPHLHTGCRFCGANEMWDRREEWLKEEVSVHKLVEIIDAVVNDGLGAIGRHIRIAKTISENLLGD